MKRLVNFSSLDQFDTCERKYYWQHVAGEEPAPSPILVTGQVYHEVIASVVREASLEHAEPHIAAALQAHADELASFNIQTGYLGQEILANVTRLYNEVLVPAGVRPESDRQGPLVERHFRNHKTGFFGTIDCVSSNTPIVDTVGRVVGHAPGRCILDWKTVTSDRRRSQRDTDLSPQLALYAWQSGAPSGAFCEIPRNLEQPLRVRVTQYTDSQRTAWITYLNSQRATLLKRGKQLESYRRTSRKNPLCSMMWCSYFDHCYPQNGLPIPPEELN